MAYFLQKFYSIVFLSLLLICSFNTQAQKQTNRFEIALQNDNDVYLLQGQDRYYTNGLKANFAVSLGQDTVQDKSHVLNVAIGHKIYNGVKMWIGDEDYYWDRSFAAQLYFNTEIIQLLGEDKLISYQLELGQIGSKAHGKVIQDFIHNMFKMYDVSGWDEELPNSLGVDFTFKYQQNLILSANHKFDVSAMTQIMIGMHNMNTGILFPIRLGTIEGMNRSVFIKGHLTSSEKNNEFFVFYEPGLFYQMKNATIGEGYSRNGLKMVSGGLRPFIFTHRLGVMFARNNSTIGFTVIQHHTESKDTFHQMHQYGQLSYSLRF